MAARSSFLRYFRATTPGGTLAVALASAILGAFSGWDVNVLPPERHQLIAIEGRVDTVDVQRSRRRGRTAWFTLAGRSERFGYFNQQPESRRVRGLLTPGTNVTVWVEPGTDQPRAWALKIGEFAVSYDVVVAEYRRNQWAGLAVAVFFGGLSAMCLLAYAREFRLGDRGR